jgi:hypothetical protein
MSLEGCRYGLGGGKLATCFVMPEAMTYGGSWSQVAASGVTWRTKDKRRPNVGRLFLTQWVMF